LAETREIPHAEAASTQARNRKLSGRRDAEFLNRDIFFSSEAFRLVV
jgi:hypothetical protein